MRSEPNESPDARTVSDEEARRLLARATEIDASSSAELTPSDIQAAAAEIDAASGAKLTLADLRAAALEAGIPRDAFEQATTELRTPSTMGDRMPSEPGRTLRRRFGAALVDTAKIAGVVVAVLLVLMLLVDLL